MQDLELNNVVIQKSNYRAICFLRKMRSYA